MDQVNTDRLCQEFTIQLSVDPSVSIPSEGRRRRGRKGRLGLPTRKQKDRRVREAKQSENCRYVERLFGRSKPLVKPGLSGRVALEWIYTSLDPVTDGPVIFQSGPRVSRDFRWSDLSM